MIRRRCLLPVFRAATTNDVSNNDGGLQFHSHATNAAAGCGLLGSKTTGGRARAGGLRGRAASAGARPTSVCLWVGWWAALSLARCCSLGGETVVLFPVPSSGGNNGGKREGERAALTRARPERHVGNRVWNLVGSTCIWHAKAASMDLGDGLTYLPSRDIVS